MSDRSGLRTDNLRRYSLHRGRIRFGTSGPFQGHQPWHDTCKSGPRDDAGRKPIDMQPKTGLPHLIGTALALSFGISMAAAAMIIAVGALLGS